MDIKRDFLMAKINLYISSAFIFSMGLFFLVIGFKVTHMANPIADRLAPATLDDSTDY